jgi:hypothetical protein
VLPSKAIRNEKIMDTLMLQANLGTFREREIDRKYLDALENLKKRRPDPDNWGTGNDSKSTTKTRLQGCQIFLFSYQKSQFVYIFDLTTYKPDGHRER